MKTSTCDVAVVGGGPAGLAAATALRQAGVAKVVVLEREAEAGGIPRHCLHSPFGMREFHRLLSGPAYARKLAARAHAAGVEIVTRASVVALEPGGIVCVATPDRAFNLQARRVLLATGARETPRSARLVSGTRPVGITTTGALQSMVNLKQSLPFSQPLIVGSELVAFSALLSCRQAGLKPVAMIEEADRIVARKPLNWLTTVLGVPLRLGTRIDRIIGKHKVEGVSLIGNDNNLADTLPCDGIVFTGNFTPEASLLPSGHLDVDPATGGPVVDQFGACSDRRFIAVGNLLRPIETAGWSWQEGKDIAGLILADLGTEPFVTTPDAQAKSIVEIRIAPPLKYVLPQRLDLERSGAGTPWFQLRVSQPVKGILEARQGSELVWSCQISARPERRILVPRKFFQLLRPDKPLHFGIV